MRRNWLKFMKIMMTMICFGYRKKILLIVCPVNMYRQSLLRAAYNQDMCVYVCVSCKHVTDVKRHTTHVYVAHTHTHTNTHTDRLTNRKCRQGKGPCIKCIGYRLNVCSCVQICVSPTLLFANFPRHANGNQLMRAHFFLAR